MSRALFVSIASLLILSSGSRAIAQEPPPSQLAAPPPRLSLVDGPTSFWRPGAQDWAPGQVNTPLAAGDFIYTGTGGNVEVQIGPRAYLRAGEGTQLQLADVAPDYLQVKVSAGQASLDLRELTPGHTVEVDTPNAAFTIERVGYYRFNIGPEATAVITRRGGTATLTPANGGAIPVSAAEEVIVGAGNTPGPAIYSAPELDVWDTWNYRRTEYLVDSMSARYVPSGVYGAADLDHNGSWRSVPEYGPIWIPSNVPAGWAPYSTGHWVYEPAFGWTWVDNAPWGWAPFHYGRWVSVNGYWAWAPGPVVARPVYSPALVAWFGGAGPGIGVGVGWVALGWGEPVVPWWGPREFVGHPYWGGWGGPRVVNQTVITNVNVTNINVTKINYTNVQVSNAVVATSNDRFGHAGQFTHIPANDLGRWHPTERGIEVKPTAASLVPGEGRAVRPPREIMDRPVVAKHESREPLAALQKAGINPAERHDALPRPVAPTIVAKPEASAAPAGAARAPGQTDRPRQGEVIERRPATPPPTFNTLREQQPPRGESPVATTRTGPTPPAAPGAPRPESRIVTAPPRQPAPRPAPAVAETRNLPGVPAMQLRPPAPPSAAQAPASHPSGKAPPAQSQGKGEQERKGQ